MQVSTQQPVKAFDLLPVLDYVAPTGNPNCVSVAGNDVYVGYTSGQVRHFLVSSTTATNGRTKYQVRYLDEMIGSTKKSIVSIIVAPTIARIIGLAENQVFVGDMFSMVGAQSYSRSTPKSVTFMSVNESSNSYDLEVAVCQSRKKSVLLMMVTTERFIVKQEIGNLQGVPQRVLWHGSVLLLAYESYYSVYNLMSRTEMELFPYNPTTTSPLIKTLGEGEIYMNGDGLGMIINESGDVCRAPIAWVNQPKYVCYSKPYIIGISKSSIQVYSLLDQQLKQKSGFNDACAASDFGGNVFIIREDQIFMLLPVPVEEQVERLLDSGHLDQAMALAEETLGSVSRTKGTRLKLLRQRAAKMYWSRGELEEAFSLFSKCQSSPEEVYSLYDTVSVEEGAIAPPISVASLPAEKQLLYHSHLLRYISKMGARTEEVNTVEFKLLALTDHGKIMDFFKERRKMNMNSVVNFLKSRGMYYLLGEYYAETGFICEAVEQWKELEDGNLADPMYPGLKRIVDILLQTNIQNVIMDNIEWLISRDCGTSMVLLTKTTADLNHDQILKLLAQKPVQLLTYLEELVIKRGTDASRFHTSLAQQYLAVLLSADTTRDTALRTRRKLQDHLLRSDKYAVSLILNKVEGTMLKKEQAILHGKLQEHDKALQVLVYEVKDLQSAEEYCREWPSGRAELHILLLKLYLNCASSQKHALQERAVDFLNNKLSVFNYSDVYKILPSHWPISLIEPFVYRSLGHQAHQYRTTRIIKGLSELEWARARAERVELTRRVVKVNTGTYCSFCFHPFTESNCKCSVATSGDVYHPQCIGQIT